MSYVRCPLFFPLDFPNKSPHKKPWRRCVARTMKSSSHSSSPKWIAQAKPFQASKYLLLKRRCTVSIAPTASPRLSLSVPPSAPHPTSPPLPQRRSPAMLKVRRAAPFRAVTRALSMNQCTLHLQIRPSPRAFPA